MRAESVRCGASPESSAMPLRSSGNVPVTRAAADRVRSKNNFETIP